MGLGYHTAEEGLEQAQNHGLGNYGRLQEQDLLREYEGCYSPSGHKSKDLLEKLADVEAISQHNSGSHPSKERPWYSNKYKRQGIELYQTWSQPGTGTLSIRVSSQAQAVPEMSLADALITAWSHDCDEEPSRSDRKSKLRQILIAVESDQIFSSLVPYYLKNGGESYVLKPGSTARDKQAFFAVLGSPTGSQVCLFLYLYWRAIGIKIITSVEVKRRLHSPSLQSVEWIFKLENHTPTSKKISNVKTSRKDPLVAPSILDPPPAPDAIFRPTGEFPT